MRIKQIDRLLTREFVPPFLMAFSIAMFVLMMQFLWLYIDDIAGKGIGILVLVEMIYYMGLSLIPMALPIAMLLASVMVYGNLAEKYELASIKTAGIPLMRVMRSSMILAALVAASSYMCSNYVIPYANLKFRSRLYDIKKQKPALNLESGVFNDDFQNYSIRIGRKYADNRRIEDIMIDDDQSNRRNLFNIIRADKGEMYLTDDDRFFIMQLEDGHQYQKNNPSPSKNNYPFIRTSFSEWSKTFDLSEFDLNRTDENLFKSYHAMLSTKQLSDGIDSIRSNMVDLRYESLEDLKTRMSYLYYDPIEATKDSVAMLKDASRLPDAGETHISGKAALVPAQRDSSNLKLKEDALAIKQHHLAEMRKGQRKSIKIDQPFIDELHQAESIVATFPFNKRVSYLEDVRNLVRNSKNSNYEFRRKQASAGDRLRKHIYQLHSKYGFAAVCFIFLFIGAPMGAIVRKGGFGYPLLVAIIFFMVFVILTKLFEKLSKSDTMDSALAAWLPCIILFPLGLFLTFKAMNDSKVINTDRIEQWFRKIFQRKSSSLELET